jgi:hypothetical protein
MYSVEPIDVLNKRLIENFGLFSTTTLPLWRVSWSEDQFEKRWLTYTKDGFELLTPEVHEVPKYRQWIKDKYILERLIAIPEYVENDLVDNLTYEPIWVFEDKNGFPLPPKWEAIYLIINQVYKAASNFTPGVAKYKDPEIVDAKLAPEMQKAKIDKLIEEMFGNETDTGDALAYREGVTVPSNFERTKTNGSI